MKGTARFPDSIGLPAGAAQGCAAHERNPTRHQWRATTARCFGAVSEKQRRTIWDADRLSFCFSQPCSVTR